jgi:ribulose-5-phosphate 4-epimerase/fuculose-1-phosphate aldolase
LLPVNQISMEFYGKVAYHDYEGVALDLSEQQRLVADLGQQPVMILRNHGLLTVGRSVSEAFMRMYYLEKACEIQLSAQASGKLVLPPHAVCAHTERQFNDPGRPLQEGQLADPDAMQLAWAALLRLLDKVAPGYRD